MFETQFVWKIIINLKIFERRNQPGPATDTKRPNYGAESKWTNDSIDPFLHVRQNAKIMQK